MLGYQMENGVFKLVNFSPIGFKESGHHCQMCHGLIDQLCVTCEVKHRTFGDCLNCTSVCKDGVYYHVHCYKL